MGVGEAEVAPQVVDVRDRGEEGDDDVGHVGPSGDGADELRGGLHRELPAGSLHRPDRALGQPVHRPVLEQAQAQGGEARGGLYVGAVGPDRGLADQGPAAQFGERPAVLGGQQVGQGGLRGRARLVTAVQRPLHPGEPLQRLIGGLVPLPREHRHRLDDDLTDEVAEPLGLRVARRDGRKGQVQAAVRRPRDARVVRDDAEAGGGGQDLLGRDVAEAADHEDQPPFDLQADGSVGAAGRRVQQGVRGGGRRGEGGQGALDGPAVRADDQGPRLGRRDRGRRGGELTAVPGREVQPHHAVETAEVVGGPRVAQCLPLTPCQDERRRARPLGGVRPGTASGGG
ncbi:hypothetical protein, partial [Streptomyces sp. MBT67]|uniref:hypothetical protein n=1 Tax=Streptomyces sp. MBT67 TaxID=1488397 RepID=UPI001F264846